MFEPWLNPQCTDMVLYAHNRGHKLRVYTTLVGMGQSDIERLAEIHFVHFSVHIPSGGRNERIGLNESYLYILTEMFH